MAALDPFELQRKCASLGFELCGLVDAGPYDATASGPHRASSRLADVGTILVLGTGGRGFWERVRAGSAELRPSPQNHPIDGEGARRTADLVRWLEGRLSGSIAIALPDEEKPLDFVRLAQLGGMGSISPVLGLLLHPVYGPWVSLRSAVLLPGRPFGVVEPPVMDFHPCEGCAQPCVPACPVGVFDGRGGVDLETCATHRLDGGCTTGCDARRACPVGAEHRYGLEEESFRHAYSLFTIQRWRH